MIQTLPLPQSISSEFNRLSKVGSWRIDITQLELALKAQPESTQIYNEAIGCRSFLWSIRYDQRKMLQLLLCRRFASLRCMPQGYQRWMWWLHWRLSCCGGWNFSCSRGSLLDKSGGKTISRRTIVPFLSYKVRLIKDDPELVKNKMCPVIYCRIPNFRVP